MSRKTKVAASYVKVIDIKFLYIFLIYVVDLLSCNLKADQKILTSENAWLSVCLF